MLKKVLAGFHGKPVSINQADRRRKDHIIAIINEILTTLSGRKRPQHKEKHGL